MTAAKKGAATQVAVRITHELRERLDQEMSQIEKLSGFAPSMHALVLRLIDEALRARAERTDKIRAIK